MQGLKQVQLPKPELKWSSWAFGQRVCVETSSEADQDKYSQLFVYPEH